MRLLCTRSAVSLSALSVVAGEASDSGVAALAGARRAAIASRKHAAVPNHADAQVLQVEGVAKSFGVIPRYDDVRPFTGAVVGFGPLEVVVLFHLLVLADRFVLVPRSAQICAIVMNINDSLPTSAKNRLLLV